jgi:hypothetical protein
MKQISLCALAVLLLCPVTPAHAGPLRISYLLTNEAATPVSISDVIFGTDLLAPVTLEGTSGPTFGTTTVSVDHGSLGAYASVDGAANVVAELNFEDTITLVSDTLSTGTLVDLVVTLDLDYSLSSSSCAALTGVARIDASWLFT